MIESGKYKFDLKTKLNDILPFDQFCREHDLKWEKTDEEIRRIKLLDAGMVLSHTTGFNLFKDNPIKSQFEPGKGYVYSNLAMFYLQKVIEKLDNTCDLVSIPSPPNQETLSDLPIKSNTAYVRSGKQLFYINKADSICVELGIDEDKLKQFDEKMNPTKIRTLSEEELNEAKLITGYTPTNLTIQRLAKEYVFDPIGMTNSNFFRKYDLALMSEDNKLKPQTQKLYLKDSEKELQYEVIGLDGELKKGTISRNRLPEEFQKKSAPELIKLKDKFLPILLAHTANAGHTTSKAVSAPNSLYTTAKDYALFVWYWMNDKNAMMQEAFHKPILQMMDKEGKVNDHWAHEFVSDNDMKHIASGLGWDLEINDQGKVIRAYKTGDMNQWRAQVAIDFEKNTVIVYFANSPSAHILADSIITPNVELKHGLNYFFKKFGFARNIENGYNLGLMSEITSSHKPEKGKIYLEVTEKGLQVGAELDGRFEKHIIPWFKLPKNFPRNSLDIINLYETNKFLPTLLLECLRIEKIDAYLDLSTETNLQPKAQTTTAKLMSGVLSRDSKSTSTNVQNTATSEQKEKVFHHKKSPKTTQPEPVIDEEKTTIFKTPKLKPRGHH